MERNFKVINGSKMSMEEFDEAQFSALTIRAAVDAEIIRLQKSNVETPAIGIMVAQVAANMILDIAAILIKHDEKAPPKSALAAAFMLVSGIFKDMHEGNKMMLRWRE